MTVKGYITAVSLLFFVICFTPVLHAQVDPADGPISDFGVVSPDGTKILFASNATGNFNLWTANADGSNARPLFNWIGSDQTDPDWSPDGKHIVFSSNRGSKTANVWIVGADGSGASQLTANAKSNRQPRVSPAGNQIVFTSNRTGKFELWLMSVDGSNQKAIGLQSLLVSDPSWSPTGTSVAFAGCTRPVISAGVQTVSATCNIYAIAVDASITTQLTAGNYLDWNPDWGASGIVFASNRSGSTSLWEVSQSGTGLKQATMPVATADLHPRWARSTGTLTFTRPGQSTNIWSLNASGQVQQITQILGFLLQGDLNSDGIVDCNDVNIVRAALGTKTGQSGFDTRADVNGDGIVNVADLALVTHNLALGTACH